MTEKQSKLIGYKIRPYAVSARAIRMRGAKIAKDPEKARTFLMEIGVVDANGELAAGFQ
jgi:hypothetical protein